jgi:hypothetical protein
MFNCLKYTSFVLIFALTSCIAKKATLKNDAKELTVINDCPKEGTCTTSILKNKKLVVKIDGADQLSYQTQDNQDTSVILFEYLKKGPVNTHDGNYREEIVFEINNNETHLKLEDIALNKTKMLFGRHCYCKGQNGYYVIEKGRLELQKKSDIIHFNLDFTIAAVPQIIKHIGF